MKTLLGNQRTVMNSVGEMVVVRKQEGRRAKVAGRIVIADGKFQSSGISGKSRCSLFAVTYSRDFTNVTSFPRDARRLKLSVCYHDPTSHFRTPSFLSSYHNHLTYRYSNTVHYRSLITK
jgi:hypothetical protein